MFIKFNEKLVNTSTVTKIEKDTRGNKLVIDIVFANSTDNEVNFETENFPLVELRDKRFAELEAMLCNNPMIGIARQLDILTNILDAPNHT